MCSNLRTCNGSQVTGCRSEELLSVHVVGTTQTVPTGTPLLAGRVEPVRSITGSQYDIQERLIGESTVWSIPYESNRVERQGGDKILKINIKDW